MIYPKHSVWVRLADALARVRAFNQLSPAEAQALVAGFEDVAAGRVRSLDEIDKPMTDSPETRRVSSDARWDALLKEIDRDLVAEVTRLQAPVPQDLIARVDALLKEITPGDWQVAPHSDTDERRDVVAGYREGREGELTIRTADWIAELCADLHVDGNAADDAAAMAELDANAAFIAAAPQLVRDLVAEVTRLQAEKDMALKALAESYDAGVEAGKAAAEALLSEAQAHRGAEWQPIETAPKDDTDLLLFGPFVPTGGTYMDIGRWTNYGGGFWDWSGDDSQPTHWMPLPSPPSQEEEQGSTGGNSK